MRQFFLLTSLLILAACQGSPSQRPTNQSRDSIESINTLPPPEFVFQINREQAHRFHVSTGTIANRIQTHIDTSSQLFTPETILDEFVHFTNNAGHFAIIPVRTLVDTVYWE